MVYFVWTFSFLLNGFFFLLIFKMFSLDIPMSISNLNNFLLTYLKKNYKIWSDAKKSIKGIRNLLADYNGWIVRCSRRLQNCQRCDLPLIPAIFIIFFAQFIMGIKLNKMWEKAKKISILCTNFNDQAIFMSANVSILGPQHKGTEY